MIKHLRSMGHVSIVTGLEVTVHVVLLFHMCHLASDVLWCFSVAVEII
jgi:hypothetical protein